jgi:polyphenol oxidase
MQPAIPIAHLVADWPAPPNVIAFTTLRHNFASPEAAKRALQAALPAPPVWIKQVHGADVFVAQTPLQDSALPVADGSVTTLANTPLIASTADCLPVFFAAQDGSAVGVAHAGWRGLAAGVLENTAHALQRKAAHTQLIAHLGPAISARAFEVGQDVFDAFVSRDPAAVHAFTPKGQGKYWGDLYQLARQRLANVGVTQVSGGTDCTVSDAQRFYSFRRDGRIIDHLRSVIWRRG